MERPLYGGALVGRLPADAQDMSNVREIPDNQEVFAHSSTDQSIIIEILEYVQETDEQALKQFVMVKLNLVEPIPLQVAHCMLGMFVSSVITQVIAGLLLYESTHFEDLASSNDAASSDNSCVLGVDELDKQTLALKECSKAYWLMGQQRVSKYKEVARNDINIHMVLYRLPRFTTDIVLTFNDPVNVNLDSSSHHAVTTGTVPWNVEDLRTLVHSLTLLDTGLFG